MPRKRPPLCPYCRYDLTGTYKPWPRHEITCSECGETFLSNEVGERRAHGEWTPIVGLRNLVIAAMWRVPVVTVLALLEFWLLNSWYGSSPGGTPLGHRWFFSAAVAAGCALGAVMNFRLNESAGFEGGVVTTVSVLGLLSASALTYVVVHNVFAPTAVAPLEVIGVMTFGGAGIIFVLHAYHA